MPFPPRARQRMRGLSRATRAVRRVCFRDDAVACDSTRSEASRCAAHPRPRKIFNAWQILTAAARRAKANGCKRGSRAAASRSHSREPGATAPRCGISCPRKIFNAWQILTAAAWRTKANGCKRGPRAAASRSRSREPWAAAPHGGISCPRRRHASVIHPASCGLPRTRAPAHPRTRAPAHPRTHAPAHPRTRAPTHPRTRAPFVLSRGDPRARSFSVPPPVFASVRNLRASMRLGGGRAGCRPPPRRSSRRDAMQRRYQGQPVGRGGAAGWQERNERGLRGGERGMQYDDEALLRPDLDVEGDYRMLAEDIGPEDWGSDWADWDDRNPYDERRRGYEGGRREREGGRGPQRMRGVGAQGNVGEARGGYAGPRGYGDDGWYQGGGRDDDGDLRKFRGQSRLVAGSRSPYRGGEREERAGPEPWRAGGERSAYRDELWSPYRTREYDRSRDYRDLLHGGGGQREMLHRQGPKGYTRSDERIREDICERLAYAFDLDVSDVSVEVNGGRVELQGTVPERWMKHEIEDIADNCMCVRDVDNRVRVLPRERGETTGTAGMAAPPEGQPMRPEHRTSTMAGGAGGAGGQSPGGSVAGGQPSGALSGTGGHDPRH
ncbi:BON domain-containing protein [Burkholderia pseudomallei]|nr:BON domain-containing protein [Burkholderia pseudomallei]MBF3422154.1 BON domain-containing protein [Burkholderia pseudomallei]MBF3461055.1 BON domain-containing protein [Burkholderia pseudomallei]MBF4038851.1 BON domain-containing protein [Burkholderia pseudomallei]MBF4053793.1 BON domain-containing protein [Burkholderia pseudomallei]